MNRRNFTEKICRGVFAIALLTGVILSCLMVPAGTVSAKMSKSAQIVKYNMIIRSYHSRMKTAAKRAAKDTSMDYSSYGTYYAYVDIDRNGIYELVVRFEDSSCSHTTSAGSTIGDTTEIYTIKNGKVKRVIKSDAALAQMNTGGTRVYKNSCYIMTCSGNSGIPDDYSKYKNGKVSGGFTANYFSKSSSSTGKPVYLINDKTVSRAKYKAMMKKVFRSGKGKGVAMERWK